MVTLGIREVPVGNSRRLFLSVDLRFWKEHPKTSLRLFTAGSTDLQHPTDHQVLPRLRPPGKASLGPWWCRPAFRGLSLKPTGSSQLDQEPKDQQ